MKQNSKHTPETCEAISKALQGVPKSQDHRDAISKALRGVPKSQAHKDKISKANKGKAAWSPEKIALLLSLRAQGLTWEKIGLAMNHSTERVRRKFLEHSS